jgi:ribosomal protein S12 methylthiotransferase accessory factor
LDEVEVQIACAHMDAPTKNDSYPMRRIERYYRNRQTYKRSDFYLDDNHAVRFKSVGRDACKNWRQLQTRIGQGDRSLLAVDMTLENAAIVQGRVPVHVVRAFIPGLLPIWFQADMQPRGMARFSEQTTASAARHAGQAFIHPFT